MSLRDALKMDKSSLFVVSLHDPSDEADYWKTQSSRAGLEALGLMRQAMYGYDSSTDRLLKIS